MSYILDALKKSEKERQLQKVPDLPTAPVNPVRRRPARWLWLLSLALVMNAAVFAWWFYAGHGQAPDAGGGEAVPGVRGRDAGAARETPAAPAVIATQPLQEKPVVPDASPGKATPAQRVARSGEGAPPPRLLGPAAAPMAVPPASVPVAVPVPESAAVDAGAGGDTEEQAPAEETTLGDEEILAGQVPGEDAAQVGVDVEPESMSAPEPMSGGAGEDSDGDLPPVAPESDAPIVDAGAESAAVPEFSALPPSIRREIPELSISIHLFSEDPARRKVGINGRMRRQGENVADGLVLEEITEDGVILAWKGKKFHLGVF
ncbi:MAG: general secretion pathway protein GspB [Thermodesulfobacteriota bacterium]